MKALDEFLNEGKHDFKNKEDLLTWVESFKDEWEGQDDDTISMFADDVITGDSSMLKGAKKFNKEVKSDADVKKWLIKTVMGK